MNAEHDSTGRSKRRVCQRCGSSLPPQKTGRPRRWCSPKCRQAAYEERHGLESWKDKQPTVNDLSDVVEAAQDRAAKRAVRRPVARDRRSTHTLGDCVSVVCADQTTMAMVIDAVADLISAQKLMNTLEGRFLARGVAGLVEAVHTVAFSVVPTNVPPSPGLSTTRQQARAWPAAFHKDLDGEKR